MLAQEEIVQQQELLAIYRTNLAHALKQAAQHGGELSAPLPTVNSIREARNHIQHIKEILHTNGVDIADHPDDIPPIRRELDKAVDKQASQVSADERSQILRRAQFADTILHGAQILWVDDHPENNIYERRVFRSLGIFVDLARSTEEALEMLRQTRYDAVISDMERDGIRDEGLKMLKQMRQHQLMRPVIFYTMNLDESRGTPGYAVGITNRPDYLLHYMIDALERERI